MSKKEELKDVNIKALFIGSKSENVDIFRSLLLKLVEEHAGWRENYIPEDPACITEDDRNSDSFKHTTSHMIEVLNKLSLNLRRESLPWHSAGRFLGHMNSETLMPAILAYTFATLWNGNNVAYESSPATSKMEEEVGMDFAKLMGFKKGWGHICADGSIANAEGLWYMRNIKSVPLAMKKVVPNLVAGKSDWELLNMSVDEILDLLDKAQDKIAEIKNNSARSSMDFTKLGKLIVPKTKHYSWLKAADILGVGTDQVIACDVTSEYRTDVKKLKEIILGLAEKKIPVLGVVTVVGSTEEGQVDWVHEVIKLRKELFEQKHIYFYVHVDAAYGGYGRAIFMDENNEFLPFEKMHTIIKKNNIFYDKKNEWPNQSVYDSFKAIDQSESVTIDPHKMGYVPYSAGGIAIRDIRMRDLISYFATYVFEKGADIPALLGAYILEGSKAGATAAAVWTAHRVLPLNIYGYGKLIGASVEGAQVYYNFLKGKKFTLSNGKVIDLIPLISPDFNMVDYVFNEKGNKDLAKMNELNHCFYEQASYACGQSTYLNPFITSHTDFGFEDYGDSPLKFVKKLGFTEEEWRKAGKVTILRSSVMTPYLSQPEVHDYFFAEIEKAMKEKLETIYKTKSL